MSVWGGLENGVPTANISPDSLAPTSQQQLQWPKWGQHFETKGGAGEPIDIPEVERLMELRNAWVHISVVHGTREWEMSRLQQPFEYDWDYTKRFSNY